MKINYLHISLLEKKKNDSNQKNNIDKIDNAIAKYNEYIVEIESELENCFSKINLYNPIKMNDLKPEDYGSFEIISNIYNDYFLYFLDENKELKFSAQTKIQPSIIEDFVNILLYSLMESLNILDKKIRIGSAHNYSKMSFIPHNFDNFLGDINLSFDTKDQDASISRVVELTVDSKKHRIDVPIIAIECKTYLDKTMLEGSASTASKLKHGNPYCFFAIICNYYSVGKKQDLKHTDLDQVYVLKIGDRKNEEKSEINPKAFISLFLDLRNHLLSEWFNVDESIKEYGTVIYK